MPSADEVIERARRLAAAAFEDLSTFSGVDTDFAHAVLDAWYEREQRESQGAGVDYFRRQAAFQLLLGLTCLPGAGPPRPYTPPGVVRVERAGAAAVDGDATPVGGLPRAQEAATGKRSRRKLSRRDRRRRG